MIGRDHLDLPALGEQAGILDRHLRGNGRAGTADIGVKAGLVAEASDLDDLVERLRESAGGQNQARGHGQGCNGSLHLSSRNISLNVCWNGGAIMSGLALDRLAAAIKCRHAEIFRRAANSRAGALTVRSRAGQRQK